MKNNLYTKEQLEEIAKSSYSIAEVLRKLGKRQTGGNRLTLMKYIDKYEIDISHFTGQRWQINKTSEEIAIRKLDTILQKDVNFKSHNLKNRLINNGLKENKCEICGINGVWNNKPITLELHHINGDHYDNRLENLQILCPNCHSQTNTFRRHNKNKRNKEDIPTIEKPVTKIVQCLHCGKDFIKDRRDRKYCSVECYRQHINQLNNCIKLSDNNSINIAKDILIETAKDCNTLRELSEKLNISRPTARKYLEQYDLLDEFKSKYNFKAIPVIQYDMNMNIIREWPCMRDAENTLKIFGIEKNCKLKRRSAGGYIWRYKTDN